MILSKKLLKKIPDSLIGIVYGTLVFYGIGILFPGIYLGETIGQIPISLQDLSSINRIQHLFFPAIFLENLDLCKQLIVPAFSISVVISLNCLLVQSTADSLLYSHSKSSRELIAQGLGNFVSGLFGGFPGNPSFSRTLKSYKGGATNSTSKLFSALFTVSVILLLKPVLPMVPKICFTAIILMLAVNRFDPWFFRLFRKIFSKQKHYRKKGVLNVIIVLIVISAMFVFGVFEAVGIGVLISIIIFVFRMGRSIIRRQFSGTRMRSNVERPDKELEILKKHGSRIRIIELEGALFFGSADKINELVRKLVTVKVDYIILDFKHVNDLDLSAVHVIHNMIRTCEFNSKKLLISSIPRNSVFEEILNLKKDVFETLEDAFAWAEDMLIQKHIPEIESGKEIPLSEIDALSKFRKKDMEKLSRYLEKCEYQKGRIVFNENDPGDAVFFLVKGRAHIFKKLQGNERKRLSTISKGNIFGEMAVIDGNPRSAGVISDGEIVCYKLDKQRMENLVKRHADIALKLLSGIGKEISKRMRIAINMNAALRQ